MSQSPSDDSGPASPWEAFSQAAAEMPPPGPELAALTGAAVANLGQLTDGQLLGVASSARRQQAHDGFLEMMAVAEFARRREEQFEASKARGDRVRSRDGEYPAEELGFEMTATAYSAAILMDMAQNIVTRLPSTLAGMAAGGIDRDRARVISNATAHLPDELAAIADEILAKAAAEMPVADLRQKAARLEARLDPEGVQARKDEARRNRRVELRREDSGAAQLSGRELDPADALTGKASIDEEAVRLRKAGLPGTLDQIRALVMMDRIHQRSPWDRLATQPEPGPDDDRGPDPDGDRGPHAQPAGPDHDEPHADEQLPDAAAADNADNDDDDDDVDDVDDDDDVDEGHPGGRTPLPALINITIPAGTLLGWSNTPADVGAWGLMDAGTVRDLIQAASRHPRTRWCYTITDPAGEAIAHACARGSHPYHPHETGPASPASPGGPELARLAALLAELNAVPEPIAKGTCDHAHREDRYIPSRKLKHLVRARTARCCGPGCGAQASTGHIDHTVPYPAGDTCEHNLSPPCGRHHHAKHAPGWKLEQTEPGVMTWTTPSGRVYTTRPTRYEE